MSVEMLLVENLGEQILVENLGGMLYLISLNPLLFKNIAHIGSTVCVSLSFCKSSSWSLSSPDDKLSENIWFVWSRTSYRVEINAGQSTKTIKQGY